MAYSTSGIVDLSTLAPQPAAPAGSSFVEELTEQNFDATVQKSVRHPIVVEFWSSNAADTQSVSDALRALAAEAGGKFLLARVNVDTEQRIASAFGVQAVPTVVGVVAGQVAPLFQGTASKEEAGAAIDQLLQLAASNGIVGRADPVAPAATAEGESEPPADPRFAAADEALAAGDFSRAVEEFDKVLAQSPNDRTASAGRAQASLLARVSVLDQQAVVAQASAHPDNVDAQLDAADVDMMLGQFDTAFARLVTVIAASAGEEKDRVRVRLLELFETMDPADPVVLKARRSLATALY